MVTENCNLRKAFNYEFEWTDEHLAFDQLKHLKQDYDKIGSDALERLQVIAKDQKARYAGHIIDYYKVLQENHGSDLMLQQYWDEINRTPEWVDWEQIKRGQDFFYRHLGPNIVSFLFHGFLGDQATGVGTAEVLIRTGSFSRSTFPRRLLETIQWLLLTTTSLEAVKPGGVGNIATVRIRLLHASVRQRICKLHDQDPAYFDTEKLGTPISTFDTIHALLGISANPVWVALPQFGIKPDAQGVTDFIAFFRYLAYLIGVPEEYLATPSKAKATLDSILLYDAHMQLTESSKTIAHDVIEGIRDCPPMNVSRPLLESGFRVMRGNEAAERLGLGTPSKSYYMLFSGVVTTLFVIDRLAVWIPSFDRWIVQALRNVTDTVFLRPKLIRQKQYSFEFVPKLGQQTVKQPNADLDQAMSSMLTSIRPIETIGFIMYILSKVPWFFLLLALYKVVFSIGSSLLY